MDSTADSPVKTEKAMATSDKPASTTSNGEAKPETKPEPVALAINPKPAKEEQGSVALKPNAAIGNRPIGAGPIEVAEMISVAGNRPIAASHMHVYATILNNRPIMASNIRVLNTTPVGDRPIFASDIVVREDLSLPGGRPVFASDHALLEAPLLPGGRPIASNEIDDSETLMGFID